jgi:hypothetical protein
VCRRRGKGRKEVAAAKFGKARLTVTAPTALYAAERAVTVAAVRAFQQSIGRAVSVRGPPDRKLWRDVTRCRSNISVTRPSCDDVFKFYVPLCVPK